MQIKIPEKKEWNLDVLFSSDDDSRIEEDKKEWMNRTEEFVNKWKSREDYLENPEVLRETLDDYEKFNADFGGNPDSLYYIWLRTQQDQNSSELKAKSNKVEELAIKISNMVQFFPLKLSKVPEEKKKEFLSSNLLKDYKHYLENLFENSKYLLSEPEEKIINLKSQSSYSFWVKMVEDFLSKSEREIIDEKGNKKIGNFEEIKKLTESSNKEVREKAAKAFNDILDKNSDSAEAEMNAILNDKKLEDELRGFERPDQERHIADDIDTEVVDSLIEEVSNNFDIPRKFYELKAKLLKLPKLKYSERNLHYGDIEKEFPFSESVEIIYRVFNKLDKDFSDIFKRMIESGQADIFPRKGKRGGAFCVNLSPNKPTFVMLNHLNKIKDVTTIAHEFGHAINAELMKKQNSLNYDTPLSTAEVASTFMEDFVFKELLKNVEDEEKLILLMQKLDDEISTIFRQASCYKFEWELHKAVREKGYLSKEEIGKIFVKHMSNYMGPSVDQSETPNWWVYWIHIRNFFYVYSYSSGLLISKSLQNSVKQDREFIGRVKNFLSAGASRAPKDIFSDLGVDISDRNFWKKGINEVRELLNETEELAKKLGKI